MSGANHPTPETNADFLRRLAQNDYMVDSNYLPAGERLLALAAALETAAGEPNSAPETGALHLPPDGTRDGDGTWRGGKWHPDSPERHAQVANDPTYALRRVIERHVRWRETALGFLRQVIDGRGTEDEWPALAEFLERSESRMVESSAEKANEELCPWKGIPKSECRKCSESAHGSEQKANEGQS